MTNYLTTDEQLVDFTATGTLGVMHLKRYWHKYVLIKAGKASDADYSTEWNIDTTLLAVLGLGIEQTIKYLYNNNPGFETFENWIKEVSTKPAEEKIHAFNTYITTRKQLYCVPKDAATILDHVAINHWNEHGYVIVRQAVSQASCRDAINAICEAIGINENDATTWYNKSEALQGIMVQIFQHSAFEKNRQSVKIRTAFEQLWQRKDLWVNADRAGFNPPETEIHKYQGHPLHWDVSLAQPIPFGTQGILYLSDTAASQGAFTLVPGFHNKIEQWLRDMPKNLNPRTLDMWALGAIPIAANAGDLIIWHQALPHGSSPNTATLPRFVQYINYAPLDAEIRAEWK